MIDGVELILLELTSSFICRLRQDALRRRVWFGVLDGTERAILNLVSKCMDRPRSQRMINVVARIEVKLKGAMESTMSKMTRRLGWPLSAR